MAAKSSSTELVATLAAKAAQIPSLRAVRLEADYIPARLPSGLVTGIWGEALIRTPEGDLRPLVIGDEIRKGDVIMTTQNGIVEIDDAGTRMARFPGTEALEQILTDLPPTGAGLTGGDPGSLLPGVRVDRVNETVSGPSFTFSGAERAEALAFSATPEDIVAPALAISSPSVTEGSGFAVFTVTLTSPNTQGTTVVLSTTEGTATGGGVDFGAPEVSSDGGVTWTPGNSVTLPSGTNGVLVRVPITPDTLDEPNETFTLTASTPSANAPGGNVTIAGTATIVDDDPTPTVVSVTPGATDTNGDGVPDVAEGTGVGNGHTVTYTVVMSNASSLPITHSFSLAGTGVNPADPTNDLASNITFTNGVVRSADGSTITVPANVLGFSVTVTTNPDAIDEENETFNITLGGVSGTVSIIDDDAVTQIDLNGPEVGNARAFNYTENDAATRVAPAMTLVDPDSNTISHATVSITGAFTPGEDVLAFTSANGIASNYDAATGVLTFTGTATLAQYQALLQSVTYFNPSENPTATPRTVSFVVFDELDRPSAPALATVNVIPVNDAPTNLPVDLAAIAEDSGVRVITQAELLANAHDVDNTVLSVVGLTATSGTLVNNGNGTWNYTPAPNDDTAVGFSYSVSDGSLSVPGSATLDITPVNDAPVNSPVALAAIAEDSGARIITQTDLLANASDIDSPTLTAANLSISAGKGTLANNNDGTWTYTPALNDDTAVSFNYTVSDGSLTVAGSASLDITPVNDAPVSGPVTLAPIAEDSVARVITQAELLINATDVDSTNLTATGLTIANGSGTLVNNNNGTWSYTPAANDDTAVSFNYTVSDGTAAVPGTATLDITPVNDAPINSPVTLVAIAEDSGARIITQAELLANASDIDSPTLTAAGLAIAAGSGTLVNNNNGTWTYTPALNDDTAVSFNYTVSDGSLTVAGSATMDITPVDDAPINTLPNPTTNLAGLTANEDSPLFFSAANGNAITVFDADIVNDAGTLTTTISVAQGTFTLASLNGITVVGNSNGTGSVTFSGTPTAINAALNGASYRNPADLYTHTSNGGFIDTNGIGLTVTTTDSTNLPDSDSVNLVVRAVADIEIRTRVTSEGQPTTPFTLASLINPNDPGSGFESPDAAITAINGISVAAGGSVTVDHGVVSLSGSQSLVFTPDAGFTATARNPASFTYSVTSGGRVEEAQFFVQVDPLALPIQGALGVSAGTADPAQTIQSASTHAIAPLTADVLNGSVGSDVFAWHLGDAGTASAPHAFTVNNFDAAPASAGGDVLDLRDLLVGENAGNMGAFLDFSKSGLDTVISVSSTGNGVVDQTITLTHVDLAAAIGLAPGAGEAQMIATLISQGKLLVVDTAA